MPGAESASYQPNFISECFFLTATALHLSLVRVFQLHTHVQRDLRELKRVIDELTESRPSWSVRPCVQERHGPARLTD